MKFKVPVLITVDAKSVEEAEQKVELFMRYGTEETTTYIPPSGFKNWGFAGIRFRKDPQ